MQVALVLCDPPRALVESGEARALSALERGGQTALPDRRGHGDPSGQGRRICRAERFARQGAHGMTVNDTLDTVGLLCPLPVLKARKRLQGLPQGTVLRVLASDPAALVDIPHFCHESGHVLLEMQDMPDGTHAYFIRRA